MTSSPRAAPSPRSVTRRGRLVEAGVVEGRRLTSWPSLQTDIRNAGGNWVDEALVTDGNLITSRNPDDLPQFCGAVVESLEHGAAAASA